MLKHPDQRRGHARRRAVPQGELRRRAGSQAAGHSTSCWRRCSWPRRSKDMGGRAIKLTFEYPAIPECRVAVGKLAEAFRIAGVEIEPVEVPESRLETELRAGRRFDLAYRVLRCDDPILEAGPILCPAYDAPPETDPLASAASPEILQLLLRLERAGDWPTARGLAIQIDRESRGELAVIPLWQLADHYAWRSRLQGPGPTADRLYRGLEGVADQPVDRPGSLGHTPDDRVEVRAEPAPCPECRRRSAPGFPLRLPRMRSVVPRSSSSPPRVGRGRARRPPAHRPRPPRRAQPARPDGESPRRAGSRPGAAATRSRPGRPRRRRSRSSASLTGSCSTSPVIPRPGSTPRGGPSWCATGR